MNRLIAFTCVHLHFTNTPTMANRRADKLCVDIRICVSNDVDDAIVNYQYKRKAAHPREKYPKTKAAADLFEELLFRDKK